MKGGRRTPLTTPHAKLLRKYRLDDLAAYFGVSRHTALKWRQRGLPPRYWHRWAEIDPKHSAAWLERTRSEKHTP